MSWDSETPSGEPCDICPNHLPDAFELGLLQYVLQVPQLDMVDSGGVSHIHTWRAWEKNLALATAQIKDPKLSHAARLAAAYWTLGATNHKRTIQKLIQDTYGIALDESECDTSAMTRFQPKGDVDNGGKEPLDTLVEEAIFSATNRKDEFRPPPLSPPE